MIILGINAYHGDSSACLIKDGEMIAAAEEERFRRVKHWAGFPSESIKYCLRAAGITIEGVDHIAFNRDPSVNLLRKALFAISRRPSAAMVKDRMKNAAKLKSIRDEVVSTLGVRPEQVRAKVHGIEHHRAHMASSFFVSPFQDAAVVSVDGFGDFVSTMWGEGKGNRLQVADQVYFPHSLGLFYLAMTQYLGFMDYGAEYKVMGLAPYGSPVEMEKMRRIVRLKRNGLFELNLDYFLHHSEGVSMVWDNGEPKIGTVYSEKLAELLGPPRKADEPLTDHHKNLAASMQLMYEDAFFHLLDHVHEKTGNPRLALAGGCAMNSVANGKIFQRSKFKDVYIQSAAGDGGGAIGAAYAVWNEKLGNARSFVMGHAYYGPGYSDDEIGQLLAGQRKEFEKAGCAVENIPDEDALCQLTAAKIGEGKVIGWFQGRMEWGPRALGNRSIIGDPRRADMKDILNLKIKRRESFRPFAPSVLREAVSGWFETDYDVPFMLQVFQIREERRNTIPAVTHVNGSGRLQTVTEIGNPRYYRLIKAFEKLTSVPMVLNTSFNENEPVVCMPQEAINCFLRTKMDVLVLGNWVVERREQATSSATARLP